MNVIMVEKGDFDMSELILWKKQELEKLRKDMDLQFRRFRRGFGVPQVDGTYPEETINFLVDRKLKKLAEGIKKFGGGPGNIDQGQ